MGSMNPIDSYRYMVQQLIAVDSPAIIGNNSPAHAKVLLEEMFAHAKSTAYVYCGKISNEVWGGDALAEAVHDAIVRKVDVKFIVQHPDQIPADSAIAVYLREKNAIYTSDAFATIGSHFAVFDSKMYRFERDDSAKTATACMNGGVSAELLHGLAKDMLKRAA